MCRSGFFLDGVHRGLSRCAALFLQVKLNEMARAIVLTSELSGTENTDGGLIIG
jgi:hypothetical protein